MLPTLFSVVNDTEQVVEPELAPQSGVTMLNNIVDNIEQYGQHNICPVGGIPAGEAIVNDGFFQLLLA